jgi:hypothetical protein
MDATEISKVDFFSFFQKFLDKVSRTTESPKALFAKQV